MQLDVIIATYNRPRLVCSALQSLLNAAVAPGLEVRVTVVDNNSAASTREAVEGFVPAFDGRLRYLFEGRQGKSYALNTGVAATGGDLVAFIDDDEEVDSGWLQCISQAFRDPAVDFIGGVSRPRWSGSVPDWLPPAYPAVIGSVYNGDAVRPYGPGFEGFLMGGNAVVRRRILNRMVPAPYNTRMGRKGAGLLTADDDFYDRLLGLGARGFYRPDLVVHHHVQPHMLTRRYHRRWCFWNAVSLALHARTHPLPAVHLLGVPRWFYYDAAVGLLAWSKGTVLRRRPNLAFSGQLDFIRLAGFFFGKYFYRPAGAGGQ